MGVDERSPRSSEEQTVTANSPSDQAVPDSKPGYHWHPLHESMRRRRSSGRISQRRPSLLLHRTQTTGRRWWKFTLRPWDDDEEQSWWFASTAIPLLAATIGPLANVFSIAALVTEWRMCIVTGVTPNNAEQCLYNGDHSMLGAQLDGHSFTDPRWCYWLNVASLVSVFGET